VKVHIKVWTSDFKECETFVFPANESIEKELIDRFVGELHKQFPNNTLKVVPIGKHRYNVVPKPPVSV